MLGTRSIMSHSSSSLSFGTSSRFQPSFFDPNKTLISSTSQSFVANYVLFSLKIERISHTSIKNDTRMNFVVHSSIQPGAPTPSGNPSHSWKGWILGMLLSIVLPFCRNKLNPFLTLKNEVEMVVETAELVVDVIEKVAEEVVEITDKVGDKLPEGGKLKDAVNLVENLAREIAKDAHLAGDLIDKVEEVEEQVESFTEPVIDQVKEVTEEACDSKKMTFRKVI